MTRLGRFSYFWAEGVLIAAVLLVVAAAAIGASIFDRAQPFDISDADSEVERAYSQIEQETGRQAEPETLLVVEPAEAATAVAQRLSGIEGIASVESPSDRGGLLSLGKTSALVLGYSAPGEPRLEIGERVSDEFAGTDGVTAGGLTVAAHAFSEQTDEDTRRIELLAAPFLLIILLLVFRSPIAAGLPLALSAASIVLTFAILRLLSSSVDIDIFSLQVVTGLGVGLAVDYSLFILARFRNEIRRNEGYYLAVLRTMATAGRTVAFSSLTVAAALASLILFPNQFLSSTGIAGALVAVLSGVLAITVLPAALALLGPRVDPGYESAPAGKAEPDPLSGGSRFWESAGRAVIRNPAAIAGLATAVLVGVASLALDGRLTTPDAGVLPEGESARQVADAIDERFPGIAPNRMIVVMPPETSPEDASKTRLELLGSNGVEMVSGVRTLPGGSLTLTAFTPTDPLSELGQTEIEVARSLPLPPGTLIAGRAAELADQKQSIDETSPLVVAIVVATTFLLILLATRSVVLPVIGILLNLLTVFAAYGLTVWLFQTETTAELLGTVAQQGIDISIPILAFAVIFGLSTDYGIFLFSRIGEARRTAASEEEAIIRGLALTGRLITTAAVIFSIAVGAFAFSDLVTVKEFAVAVSLAVLIDATIVRCALLPAILRMLGGRAWSGPWKEPPPAH